MSIINNLENKASIVYNGATITSLPVATQLLIPPTILKTVDKAIASINDILTYTVVITNVGLSAITNIPFTDVLPAGSQFVTGSFKENNAQVTPTLTNNTLTYKIPSIAALGITTLTFQVTVIGGSSDPK